MKKISMILFSAVMATSLAMARPQDSAKQDVKDAGHDTAHAAKKTGSAVKKGTKKTGDAVENGSKKAYHGTKKGVHKAADATADKTK